MSKVVIFSDWHIHSYKNFSDNVDRLDNCLRVLEDLGEFCHKYDITTIIHGGDIFDTHKALLTNVINKTTRAFAVLFEKYPDLTFYSITGNHDQASKNLIGSEAVSALRYLEDSFYGRFVCFDNDIVELPDGTYIGGVPYYEYPEHFNIKLLEMNEAMEQATSPTDLRYLFIHQTPKGIGNEMIPTDCNPKDEAFSIYQKVFCGHIHKRQDITEDFYVIGSPLHRDLGDLGETKGFYVFNTEKPEKRMFVPLVGYPEFKEVFLDEVDEVQEKSSEVFLVKKMRPEVLKQLSEGAKVEEFSTHLQDSELLTNYWEEVGGNDKELLTIGLTFLK